MMGRPKRLGVLIVPAQHTIGTIQDIKHLRRLFPGGKADALNFVLFSTSGVHGSYTTIEQIERSLAKYGAECPNSDDPPADWADELTVVVVRPRVVTMLYGTVIPAAADIAWLKRLRDTSHAVVADIGCERSRDAGEAT
jgi:hypothetical protein